MSAEVVPYSWALSSPIFRLVFMIYSFVGTFFSGLVYLLLFLHFNDTKIIFSLKFIYTCCFLLLLLNSTSFLWRWDMSPKCFGCDLILIFMFQLSLCIPLLILKFNFVILDFWIGGITYLLLTYRMIHWLAVYSNLVELFLLTCVLLIVNSRNELKVILNLWLSLELAPLFRIVLRFSFSFQFLPFFLISLSLFLIVQSPSIACNACSTCSSLR